MVTSAIGDLFKGQGSILSESALIKARMLRAGTLNRYVNATYSQHERRGSISPPTSGKAARPPEEGQSQDSGCSQAGTDMR